MQLSSENHSSTPEKITVLLEANSRLTEENSQLKQSLEDAEKKINWFKALKAKAVLTEILLWVKKCHDETLITEQELIAQTNLSSEHKEAIVKEFGLIVQEKHPYINVICRCRRLLTKRLEAVLKKLIYKRSCVLP